MNWPVNPLRGNQTKPLTGEPCAGNPPARFGGGRGRNQSALPTPIDLGNPRPGRPRDLILIYSQHYCTRCRKYFNADMTDLAAPGGHYTRRVVDTAVHLVIEDGLPYRTASWSLWRDHRVFVPYATFQNWVEDGGKRHSGESPPITSTGRYPTSRATSPPTSCMTARSVSCRSSITAPSSGCPTMSWTATRPKSTSRHSSAASARPWRHAG